MVNRYIFLLLFLVFNLFAQTLDDYIKALEGNDQIEAKRAYTHIKNLYIQAIMNNNESQINKLDKILKKYKEKFEPNQQDTQTQEKQKIPKRLVILDAEFDGLVLRLSLNNELKESEIRAFNLNDPQKKVYRYVYDIKGVIDFKAKSFKVNGIDKVKIAQFDNTTTRVVFYDNEPMKITIDTSDRSSLAFKIESKNQPKKEINSDSLPQKEQTSIAPAKSIKKRTIVIDPGHGGKDCGTISPKGICEKKIVLEIAKMLEKELQKLGYRVHLTRTKDVFIKLKDRTTFANQKSADAFVSIHLNAMPDKKSAEETSGIETFFLSTARSERAKNVAALENKEDIEDLDYFTKEIYLDVLNSKRIIESNKLAIDIHKNILMSINQMTSVVDNGVREGPFWVLVGAQMPSVLVEVGYLSHPKESELLTQTKYQKLIAEGIALGIDSYFRKLP